MTDPDHLTRPHPFGAYVAGGQVPAPEDLRPDGLELDAAVEDLPVPGAPVQAAGYADREPVRLFLRPVLVALLALVTAYGLVDDTVAPAWLALVDALVAVGGWLLVERLRANVYSPRGAERKAERAAHAAAARGRDAWTGTVSTETTSYRLGPL